MSTTVSHEEISRFAGESSGWWDEGGAYASLHRLNPLRIEFIRDRIAAHTGRDPRAAEPLSGLRILDTGCGGGLVCEPLRRLGADVTGIDADDSAIAVASTHAQNMGLDIDYKPIPTDQLIAEKPEPFDVVLALEIVEHVSDPALFMRHCAELCRKGGLVITSTLNRTPKSFALGVIAAEYILRWVPRDTHNWKKFLKPAELARAARPCGLRQSEIKGMIFDPRSGEFKLSDADIDVNYFSIFVKAAV
jgi:2-polyprenyl-6-hydroxyphenyl methylase/3-demethylubiquinone-9 3-methyltransferase